MKLQVQSLWSTDLNLPQGNSSGVCSDFKVSVQVAVGEPSKAGGVMFSLVVCSPSMLPHAESGCFVSNTLILESFDWQAILHRIETELLRCDSCPDWAAAIHKLSGRMQHEVAEISCQ
jgi:hypothetical protein